MVTSLLHYRFVLYSCFHCDFPFCCLLWITSQEHKNATLLTLLQSLNVKYYSEEMMNFSGEALPQEIKDRINSWVEDIHAIILLNPSNVYTKRIIASIQTSDDLYIFTQHVFVYFLSELNIYISEDTAQEYTSFILKKIILPKIT